MVQNRPVRGWLRPLRPLATVLVLVAAGLAIVGAGLGIGLVVLRHTVPSPTPVHCGTDADGLPTCAVSYADVKTHPESQLQYPGATVLHPFGSGEATSIDDGKESAFAGAVMATQATPDTVRAWYVDWLTSHGWSAPYSVPRLSNQTEAYGFRRGSRERFTLAFDSVEGLSGVIGTVTMPPGTSTLFEGRYLLGPYSASPAAAPSAT
jgi:hypothetical protein